MRELRTARRKKLGGRGRPIFEAGRCELIATLPASIDDLRRVVATVVSTWWARWAGVFRGEWTSRTWAGSSKRVAHLFWFASSLDGSSSSLIEHPPLPQRLGHEMAGRVFPRGGFRLTVDHNVLGHGGTDRGYQSPAGMVRLPPGRGARHSFGPWVGPGMNKLAVCAILAGEIREDRWQGTFFATTWGS